jgi:hypothetical protein
MNKIPLIGISAQSPVDRMRAAKQIESSLNYPLLDYDAPLYDFLKNVTGLSEMNDELMNAFLGREWSYVREEKFTENGELVFKPVRYYLTPKQILTKLRYNLREIHADFWVNDYYNNYSHNGVIPVRYPNEADGVSDHNGILIRIENENQNGPITRENTLMDTYKCDHTILVNNNNFAEKLDNLLWDIEKSYPGVFTSK